MENETEVKTKKKKSKVISMILTVFIVLVMGAGFGLLLYPTVSNMWNEKHTSKVISGYVEQIESMDTEVMKKLFEEAQAYNAKLQVGTHFTLTDSEMAEYEKTLDVTGTGIMGYIEIPSINVLLPIYHGVSEGVLQIAVGHLPGSSLPVEGESTHVVVSGHRGLPSAKLFTNLDKLKEGDEFYLHVLDRTYTYQVDQIRIVTPDDASDLGIVREKEYCTMITCTPLGVNTHRMLVRGVRIDTGEDTGLHPHITGEASRIPSQIVILAIMIPLLLMGLIVILILTGRNKRKIHIEE